MTTSSISFLVILRSFGGFLALAKTTSDTLLHDFVTVVSGVLGVPEHSMRIFTPNDEFLPPHIDLKKTTATVGETGIDGETTLRILVTTLRDDDEQHKEAGLRIPTSLPLASQFLLWAAREGREDVGIAVMNRSEFVGGGVSDAVRARTGNSDIWGDGLLTPLMLAACRDDGITCVDLIDRMLAEMTSGDIALQSERGRTALHCAVSFDQTEVVRMLLNVMSSDDVTIQDRSGNTSLHDAVTNGGIENVRLMTHAMPRVTCSVRNKRGGTALHEVSATNRVDIARELLSVMNAEDVAVKDASGRTALHDAIRFNSINVMQVLLPAMSARDVAVQDGCGVSALHDAANVGDAAAARALLARMPTPEKRESFAALTDSHGRTALHYAVDHGHVEAARTLMASMTRETVSRRDGNGWSAMDHADNNGVFAQFTFLNEK